MATTVDKPERPRDLYNSKSVKLAEATRVRLFLPGLGGPELTEEEERTANGQASAASSDAARKAKKRMAKLQMVSVVPSQTNNPANNTNNTEAKNSNGWVASSNGEQEGDRDGCSGGGGGACDEGNWGMGGGLGMGGYGSCVLEVLALDEEVDSDRSLEDVGSPGQGGKGADGRKLGKAPSFQRESLEGNTHPGSTSSSKLNPPSRRMSARKLNQPNTPANLSPVHRRGLHVNSAHTDDQTSSREDTPQSTRASNVQQRPIWERTDYTARRTARPTPTPPRVYQALQVKTLNFGPGQMLAPESSMTDQWANSPHTGSGAATLPSPPNATTSGRGGMPSMRSGAENQDPVSMQLPTPPNGFATSRMRHHSLPSHSHLSHPEHQTTSYGHPPDLEPIPGVYAHLPPRPPPMHETTRVYSDNLVASWMADVEADMGVGSASSYAKFLRNSERSGGRSRSPQPPPSPSPHTHQQLLSRMQHSSQVPLSSNLNSWHANENPLLGLPHALHQEASRRHIGQDIGVYGSRSGALVGMGANQLSFLP